MDLMANSSLNLHFFSDVLVGSCRSAEDWGLYRLSCQVLAHIFLSLHLTERSKVVQDPGGKVSLKNFCLTCATCHLSVLCAQELTRS